MRQIGLDMLCGMLATELIVDSGRHEAKIGNDMLLHPRMNLIRER